MKTKLIAATTAIALGAAFCIPQPAQAGDKEIAAAFAGLAAAAVWFNHHQASEREQAYEAVPVRHGYTPSRRGTVTYQRPPAYHPARGRSDGRGSTYRRCAPPRGPVIRYYGPNKRVCQPRVHGRPASLQVWSPRRRAWVTVGRHPSIW